MKIEVSDRTGGVRTRIARGLGLGLGAWLALGPGWAQAAPAAPPETSLTFNEDVKIQKAWPTLTLHDPTVSPTRGLFIDVSNPFEFDEIQFKYLTGQSTGRMFSYGIATQRFSFTGHAGFAGRVGIGVNPNSEATVHLRGGSGDTRLLVEETNSTVIGRNLLRLANNGPATFRFENRASGATWGFGTIVAQDKFFISQAGAAGLDLTLDGAGNLTILGTLTQLSDRNAKRDVEAVDGRALLERIAALPLSTWSYKADVRGARHIGPMAQDFAAAFGLGADETHVAPSDVAGLGLAAVQALKRENDELRASLEQLAARLAALEGRSASEGSPGIREGRRLGAPISSPRSF